MRGASVAGRRRPKRSCEGFVEFGQAARKIRGTEWSGRRTSRRKQKFNEVAREKEKETELRDAGPFDPRVNLFYPKLRERTPLSEQRCRKLAEGRAAFIRSRDLMLHK